VLYRTIVLEEDNVIQELATYRCIERLLEPSDTLRQHVRFMHVRSFKGDDDSLCMNMRLLVACLLNIRKLDTFRFVYPPAHLEAQRGAQHDIEGLTMKTFLTTML
jgi:hypothetical protein